MDSVSTDAEQEVNIRREGEVLGEQNGKPGNDLSHNSLKWHSWKSEKHKYGRWVVGCETYLQESINTFSECTLKIRCRCPVLNTNNVKSLEILIKSSCYEIILVVSIPNLYLGYFN